MRPEIDRMLIGLIAPLRERAAPDLAPVFLVPVDRRDWPSAAVVDLSRLRTLDPAAVAGHAGQLTHATLQNLATATRTYLAATD